MNAFLTTIRQDLVGLRWYLPAWLASLVATILINPGHLEPNAKFTLWITLVLLLTALGSGAGVFGSLMFTHPVRDDRNGWRSRPLRPLWVGVEKFLLVLLLLIVPLASALAGTAGNKPGDSPWENGVLLLIGLTFAALLFIYIAAACRNSRALLVALLIALFIPGLVAGALMWLRQHYGWPSMSEAGSTVAGWVYVIGLIALILRQYVRPHLGHHLLGGLGLVLTLALISLVSPNPRRPLPSVQTVFHAATILSSAPQTTPIEPRYNPFARFATGPLPAEGQPQILTPWSFTVKLDGFAPHRLWQAHLRTQKVGRWRTSPFDQPANGYFPAAALLDSLGLAGYSLDGADDPRRLVFGLQLISDHPITHLPSEARIGLYFYRLTARPAIVCPLKPGEHTDPDSGVSIEVGGLDPELAEASLKIQLPDEDLFSVKARGERAAHFALLAVHDASRRVAVINCRLPTLADRQVGKRHPIYLLPRWNVPLTDLRLVGVINTPDGHVYLPDLTPPPR